MLFGDFDVTGRLVRVQNASQTGQSSKYYITLANNYFSRKANDFKTMFREFPAFNLGKYPLINRLNKQAIPGDIIEIAGNITPQHKVNGTWYNGECVVRSFKLQGLSNKHRQSINAQLNQRQGVQQQVNNASQQNPFANQQPVNNGNQQSNPMANNQPQQNGNQQHSPLSNRQPQQNGNQNQPQQPVNNGGQQNTQQGNRQPVNSGKGNQPANNPKNSQVSGGKKINISDDDLPF